MNNLLNTKIEEEKKAYAGYLRELHKLPVIVIDPLGFFIPPHFPRWFEIAVYALAVVAIIMASLEMTFCPPCQICVGTSIGQVCIEKLPEIQEWLPLNTL